MAVPGSILSYTKLARLLLGVAVILLGLQGHNLWEGYNIVASSSILKSLRYEAVGVLVPMGYCLLVLAFVLLCTLSYLQPNSPPTTGLKVGTVIAIFLGGVLEFSAVILWRHTVETFGLGGQLTLAFTFAPTVLMLGVLLAVLAAVLLIIDMCTHPKLPAPASVMYKPISPAYQAQHDGTERQSLEQTEPGPRESQVPASVTYQAQPVPTERPTYLAKQPPEIIISDQAAQGQALGGDESRRTEVETTPRSRLSASDTARTSPRVSGAETSPRVSGTGSSPRSSGHWIQSQYASGSYTDISSP